MNFHKSTSRFKQIVLMGALAAALLPLTLQAGTLTCPSLNAPGDKVFALPGSTFGVCWEDLALPGGDKDYNDQILTGTVSADGTSATLSFYGSDAAINDTLRYQGVDVWSNGSHAGSVTIATSPLQEVLFALVAAGNTFFTGTSQAIVWQVTGRDGVLVPEPSVGGIVILVLMGCLGYSIFAGYRREKREREQKEETRLEYEKYVAATRSGAFSVDLQSGRITLLPGVWRIEQPIVFMTSHETRLVGVSVADNSPFGSWSGAIKPSDPLAPSDNLNMSERHAFNTAHCPPPSTRV